MTDLLRQSFEKLLDYVVNEDFKGYDPYDTLNSFIPFSKFGKWPPVIAIQVQKYNPINIRSIIGIRKEYNPKGMGLLLQAFSKLYGITKEEYHLEKAHVVYNWIKNNYTPGYSGKAWGYNFDWASSVKLVKKGTPSSVVTGYVVKGLYEYYKQTENPEAADLIISASNFILNDLDIYEDDSGICISYTPVMKDCCYNASLLAAEILSYTYSLTSDNMYRDMILQAIQFVISRMHDDGHWNYSIDLNSGKERRQIDFHQGFVLESLYKCTSILGLMDENYKKVLQLGSEYYMNEQFCSSGRSLWRIPKQYPVDIHNQSQGIITFSLLKELDVNYVHFALKIAEWTIENMQHHKGYFYYRIFKNYTIKIPFMRWSQAWMLLSFTFLFDALKENR